MISRRMLEGAVAGALATVPMTLSMLWMYERLPRRERYPLPPREITEELAEEAHLASRLDDREMREATLAAHFGYGAGMGALYGAFARAVPGHPALKGTAFGVAVWTGSYLGLLPAAGILEPATKHPAHRNELMIAAHLVWGSSLGWIEERLRADARGARRPGGTPERGRP